MNAQQLNCIFCKISRKEEVSDIVFENAKIIGFKDIHPKAPVHILIIPKKHINSVSDAGAQDKDILGEMVLTAKEVAKMQKIDGGYKLLFNVGRQGGQIIDHIHLHLMGGWQT